MKTKKSFDEKIEPSMKVLLDNINDHGSFENFSSLPNKQQWLDEFLKLPFMEKQLFQNEVGSYLMLYKEVVGVKYKILMRFRKKSLRAENVISIQVDAIVV